jgi:hypothetical protein
VLRREVASRSNKPRRLSAGRVGFPNRPLSAKPEGSPGGRVGNATLPTKDSINITSCPRKVRYQGLAALVPIRMGSYSATPELL